MTIEPPFEEYVLFFSNRLKQIFGGGFKDLDIEIVILYLNWGNGPI